MTPNDVLEFWLGSGPTDQAVRPEVSSRWWKKDAAFDAEIRERFGAVYDQAVRGELDGWSETPRGNVALVVVLDQFSRNIHRDDPRAWAADDKARQRTLAGLARGDESQLGPYERMFLYMPLMHAEDRTLQQKCVERFEALAREAPESLREGFEGNLRYAHAHRDIIERFGRFPHRNAVLGRESTAEEIEFLKQPGSSF